MIRTVTTKVGTCDICKKQLNSVDFKLGYHVAFRGDGLDFSGCAVGPAFKSGEYDLCGDCGNKLQRFLDGKL